MKQAKGYVDTEYLEVVGDFGKHVKQRSYALMNIRPGHKVLEYWMLVVVLVSIQLP
jgi:hypothetical protein